jgi:hypothetical protein
MSALFLLLLLFLAACALDTAETILFVGFPDHGRYLVARFGRVAALLDYAKYVALVTLGILWISLLALAVRGSTWKVPLLKRLSAKKWIIRISSAFNSAMLVLIPLAATFAAHATSLTRRSAEGAAVYFLYDQGVGVPRWGFAMGLCRISLQARRIWGNGSTVLDRLNRDTLNTALANAKVLILATHGSGGSATTWSGPEVLRIDAPEIGESDENGNARFLHVRVLGPEGKWGSPERVSVNDDLKLAYLFACDGGARAAQWKEHLAPAKLIAYGRVSTIWDHALWFALVGPSQLARLR